MNGPEIVTARLGRLWPDAGAMFRDLVAKGGDKPVFRFRQGTAWAEMSWRDFGRDAQAFGLEALARGLGRGDSVAILASTRPEWLVADLGTVGAGLVSTGIYPTEPPKKVAYVINDCRARVVFADTAEQVEKLQAVRADCPSLEIVVVLDPGAVPPLDPGFVSLQAWLASGRARAASAPSAWDEAGAAIGPDDTAILIYTSGTTGPPKGAMIPHGALAYQVTHGPGVFRMQAGWVRPAFLPLCHIAERIFSYESMAAGMTSVFVDGPGPLIEAMPDLRPQFFVAVPRVYEKLQAAAQDWIARQPPESRDALRAGQARAVAAVEASFEPAKVDLDAMAQIRGAVGLDRAQVLISGGARMRDDLIGWLKALGTPARDLYGMTECGMVAVNFDGAAAPGVVGRPCDYGEVRLAETGEILVRGPHVFGGYLNLPDKTAEVLRDGWYHTGDVGRFDADGRLVLLDRLKDIIISSSGKNITPSEVEGALKASPYIADAVAVGEGRHYLTALVILDPAAMGAALAERGEHPADFAGLAASPTTHALIAQAVEAANSVLSRPESVRAFRIVPRELAASDEVLTPTLKIKRRALVELFADLVDDMYPKTESAGASLS